MAGLPGPVAACVAKHPNTPTVQHHDTHHRGPRPACRAPLPVSIAVRQRQRVAHALHRRRPAGRTARVAAAWQSHLGLPVAGHHSASAGSRLSRDRARPDRFRPVRTSPRRERAQPGQPCGRSRRPDRPARPRRRLFRLSRLGRSDGPFGVAHPAGTRGRRRRHVHLGMAGTRRGVSLSDHAVADLARAARRPLPVGAPGCVPRA